MKPLLRLDNATIASGGNIILRHVSLQVAEGQKLLIDGPSGCGKSSLLRALLGFSEIRHGDYLFRETPMTSSLLWVFRKQTGYVPQELDVGSGRVEAWVQETLRFGAANIDEAMERFKTELATVRLPSEVIHQDLQELSRGERQRLTLATILSRQPKIFLLDEITSALGPDLKHHLAKHFAQLKNVTVIAVSHDPMWRDQKAFDHLSLKDAISS